MIQRSVPPFGTKHNIYRKWIESQENFISLGWNNGLFLFVLLTGLWLHNCALFRIITSCFAEITRYDCPKIGGAEFGKFQLLNNIGENVTRAYKYQRRE